MAEKYEAFRPGLYLNGFPKSGLHMIEAMVWPLVSPMPRVPVWAVPWAGTFRDNSWTMNWDKPERLMFKVGRLLQGHYLLAHSGYTKELEDFLYYKGCVHVFIYRDFRDVAVSQAFHILNEDDTRFNHPDKDKYRALGSFDDVLTAVIVGLDKFPGVMERWEAYAPWLDSEHALCLRYEDVVVNPDKAARELFHRWLNRIGPLWGQKPSINPGAVDILAMQMVDSMRDTKKSATFRKGKAGGWSEYLTEEHLALLKEEDKNDWHERLNYS